MTIAVGKTVRYRDSARQNYQALVTNVIPGDDDGAPPRVDLVFVAPSGVLLERRLVPHRSRVTTPGLADPKKPASGLAGPYPEHWL